MPKEITEYLRRVVDLGGSDLHLATDAPPAARIHGKLRALDSELLTAAGNRDLIHATLTESQRARLEDEWELDYALQVTDVGRFRGNVHFARGRMEAAFRFIPSEIPELGTLGHLAIIHDLCTLRRGLILITGITGSGKSTTLASMIQQISRSRSGVIVTIEDPIEFLFSHGTSLVKQREVGRDTHSFPTALRQALRQDPDVIVVSEMRDLETIRIALTAAETGHLVLATLHTADAPQSIDRLVDVFPPEQQQQILAQLGSVLEAVVSQRLLPRAKGGGRVLATEVLRANHAVRNCIRDHKLEQMVGLMEIGARGGNQTIDESLASLLDSGSITREEALANCRDPRRFQAPPPPPPEKKSRSMW